MLTLASDVALAGAMLLGFLILAATIVSALIAYTLFTLGDEHEGRITGRRHGARRMGTLGVGVLDNLDGMAVQQAERSKMREFNGSLTLTTPPLSSAKLVWSRYGAAEGAFPLTVVNNTDGTSTVSTTAGLPRGVMKLCVTPTNTACCPRWLSVWSDGCPDTSTPTNHTSSLDNNVPVPSCAPAVTPPGGG